MSESLDPAALRHYSVVGAVKFPGTYAGARPAVMLRTLVEQAGGLTAEAAGTVRILHAGKQQLASIAPLIDRLIVPPESVVVVDSAVAGPRAAVGDQRAYIDIACLNLCERPVVLFLDPQEAGVTRLLSVLGQPAELANTVQVISSPAAEGAVGDSLSSGAVLVFDPGALNQRALVDVLTRWPLQDLVALEPVDVQQTAAETVELFQFLEDRMQPANDVTTADGLEALVEPGAAGAVLLAPPVETGAISAPESYPSTPATLSVSAPDPEPIEPNPPVDSDIFPASALQLRSVSGLRTLPEASAEQLHPKEESHVSVEEELDPEVAQAMDAAVARHQASDELLPPNDHDANGIWLRFGRNFAAWLLCGLAAYGAFGIWMRQRDRRRPAKPRPLADDLSANAVIPLETRSTLSQLIDNSLPFREEEAPTPSQVFHGRTVGFRYLIRSGPHPIQGPHFSTQRVSPSVTQPVATATRSTSTTARAATEFPGRAAGSYGRIDAATGSGDATESRRTAATSERGVSPLERALRSLLREGRDNAP